MASVPRSDRPLHPAKAVGASFGIALALIFALMCLGIVMEHKRRRREGYVPMAADRYTERTPPETLLGRLGERGPEPKPVVTSPMSLPTTTITSPPSISIISESVASSSARSSIRSITSFFTDSSSWDSENQRPASLLSVESARSSRSSRLELSSLTPSSDNSQLQSDDWRHDEMEAAARILTLYGRERQSVMPIETINGVQLAPIAEEHHAVYERASSQMT